MGDVVDLFGRRKKNLTKQEQLAKALDEELYNLLKRYVGREIKPSTLLLTLTKHTGLFLARFRKKEDWYPKVLEVLDKSYNVEIK